MKKGWEYGTLEDAVNKGSSNISLNKIKDEVGEYPVFKAKGFAQNVSFFHQEKEYLAIIKDGAGIGRVSKHPAKSSVVATMQYLIPKEGFDIGFVEYFLNGIDFEKHRNGSTIPHINFKDYKSEAFPLLTLTEQQHIVAILDKTFTAIAQAKANAEQNLLNAKELFESYLQNVFENKGDDWEEKRFDEICVLQRGFDLPTRLRKEGIYPLVSSNGITDYVDVWKVKSPGVSTGRSGTIGKVHFIKKDYFPLNTSLYIKEFYGNDEKCIYYFLKQFDLSRFRSGAGVPTLNRNNVHSVKVYFPKSLKKQQQIVKKLNSLSVETKKLEAIYQQKINDLEELKKSVLEKAFKGELSISGEIKINNTIAVIPNISTTDLHAGIIAIALQRHIEKNKENTFHHVKSEKIIHLAETFVGIHLNRNPVKDAAGPNDFPLAKKIESRARKAGFFTVAKQDGMYAYRYRQGSQFEKLIAKVKLALNEKNEPLMSLIDLMVPMSTQQAEIVATVYAAWNNLIIDNKTIDDEAIVSESRENWHKEKLTIPREKFFKAITWMKNIDIVPNGIGKKVISKQKKN